MTGFTKCVVGAGLVAAVLVLAGAAEAGSYGYGASGYGYGTTGYGYGTAGYGVAAGGCDGPTGHAGYGTASRHSSPASAYHAPSYDRWDGGRDGRRDDRNFGRTADLSYGSYGDPWSPPSYDDGCTTPGRYEPVRRDRHDAPKLGSA